MGQAGGGGISPFKWRVRHRACSLIENDSESRWAHSHTGWRKLVQKNPPRPCTHTTLFLIYRGRGLKLRTFLSDLSSSVAWVGWEGRVRGLQLCQDKNLINPPKRLCQFVLTTPPPPHIGCSLIGSFFSSPPSPFPFILFWRNQENKKVYYLLRRLIPPPYPRSPSPTPVINHEVKQIIKSFALHDKLWIFFISDSKQTDIYLKNIIHLDVYLDPILWPAPSWLVS